MSSHRERIVQSARQWRLYALWRGWRERQQVERFDRLMALVGASDSRYSETALAEAVRGLIVERKGLPRRPGIAAFGTSVWEDKGLWQALCAAGEFTLFDYAAVATTGRASVRRRFNGEKFVEHVRAREAAGHPVHMAFLYASGEHVDPDMLRLLARSGIWTIMLSLDDKQQMVDVRTDDLLDWQFEAAMACDLYWTTWRAGADWLTSRGIRAWYAPAAADPEIFSPRVRERDLDVLWIGSAYGRRPELVRYLKRQGFRIHAVGSGWRNGQVGFEEMLNLYARAKVVLGMGGVGQTDRIKHLKGRDFEVPMAETVYLTSFNPELSDWYQIGSEILCYSSFEECAEVLSWILRRPELAAQIRSRARARCLREHTWSARIGRLMQILRGEPTP